MKIKKRQLRVCAPAVNKQYEVCYKLVRYIKVYGNELI